MPSTQELVSQLEYDLSWPVEGATGILYYFNECHRYMMAKDIEIMVAIDPVTGRPPNITTVGGTSRYDAPANARRVSAIMIDGYTQSTAPFLYNYYNQNRAYPYNLERMDFCRHPYYKVPIRSQDATINTRANYTFPYDPGDSTDLYILYYEKPRDIMSMNIQPQMPEEYHWILQEGVRARVKEKEYGDHAQFIQWRDVTVPEKFWNQMEDGGQGQTYFVYPRDNACSAWPWSF